MKRFISIVLSIMMILSVLPFSSSANSAELVTTQTISDTVTNILYLFKNVIDGVLGLLGGDKNINENKYSEMAFEVPGLDDDFIPQGLCYVEKLGMFAISGYLPKDKDGNKRNSRIYLINPDTKESKMFEIDGYSGHAGGIASSGNDIWLSTGGSQTTNGKIYHFTTDMFEGNSGKVKQDGYFSVATKGSVLYCDDNKLWVCEFYNDDKDDNLVNETHHYGKNHAWAVGYDLPLNVDYSAKEKLVPDVVLSIPDKVQGMSITADGEMIFSTSYGRRNNSRLQIFENYTKWDTDTVDVFGSDVPLYVSTHKTRIMRFTMPTLMEGIDYENGKLYIVFESGAKTYADAKEINKDVWEMDIDSILDK